MFDLFTTPAIMNTAINISVPIFIYVFSSLGCISRSGIAGFYGNSMLNLLRNCWIALEEWLTIFHSQQQYMSFPISPHPPQYLLLSVFLITAISGGLKWLHIVVLMCIFLIG